MTKGIVRHTRVIDAKGVPLGRVATQAAHFLIGKHKVEFAPNRDAGDAVCVKNIRSIAFTGKKLAKKHLVHHSLHLGGLKEAPLRELFEKSPDKVLRRAVHKMLPKNSFRDTRIKRLTIAS